MRLMRNSDRVVLIPQWGVNLMEKACSTVVMETGSRLLLQPWLQTYSRPALKALRRLVTREGARLSGLCSGSGEIGVDYSLTRLILAGGAPTTVAAFAGMNPLVKPMPILVSPLAGVTIMPRLVSTLTDLPLRGGRYWADPATRSKDRRRTTTCRVSVGNRLRCQRGVFESVHRRNVGHQSAIAHRNTKRHGPLPDGGWRLFCHSSPLQRAQPSRCQVSFGTALEFVLNRAA